MKADDYTLKALDQVRSEQEQMQKQVQKVRMMQYRHYGRVLIQMDEETRKQMITGIRKKANDHCSQIYEQMNRERASANLPELFNPYA